MNALCRGVIVFFMAAAFVPSAWANAPKGKEAVQNSATVKARLEQAEKDVVAAEKKLQDYQQKVNRYLRSLPCGTEVMGHARDLREARERLGELEKNGGDAADVNATKAKIVYCERYFQELDKLAAAEPLLNMDEITPKMMNLRRKVADLIAQRDLLKEAVSKTPAKKAS